MKEHKIQYEPHPVSPERKAELRAQGFQIVDIAYKPQDAEENVSPSSPMAKVKALLDEKVAAEEAARLKKEQDDKELADLLAEEKAAADKKAAEDLAAAEKMANEGGTGTPPPPVVPAFLK